MLHFAEETKVFDFLLCVKFHASSFSVGINLILSKGFWRSLYSFRYEWNFELPSQIFVSNFDYVQVRRSLDNYEDNKSRTLNKHRNEKFVISFCFPGLTVVRCFVPRETELSYFLKILPQKTGKLDYCLFRAIQASIIYYAEKNHTLTTHLYSTRSWLISPPVLQRLQRVPFSVFSR